MEVLRPTPSDRERLLDKPTVLFSLGHKLLISVVDDDAEALTILEKLIIIHGVADGEDWAPSDGVEEELTLSLSNGWGIQGSVGVSARLKLELDAQDTLLREPASTRKCRPCCESFFILRPHRSQS